MSITATVRWWLVVIAITVSGCGHRKPLTPDIPRSGNAEARARFQEARTAFLRDGTQSEEFERIASEFPNDPIVPWAKLYAGITAVRGRKFEDAEVSLQPILESDVPEGLVARAQLFLGIAKNYRGDAAGALPLLKKGARAIEGDDERLEWLAATAYATARVEPLASLALFDQLYGKVSPTERALIVSRLDDVVAAAEPEALRGALDHLSDRTGPATAVAASRLSLIAARNGNADEAARMRELAAPARAAVGLPKRIATTATVVTTGGRSGIIGAVMPVTGNRAGDAAIAGLGLAAGAPNGVGVAPIEVRTAGDGDAAALAVEALAKQDVVAVIGPIEKTAVDRAGERAEGLAVPLLSLSPRPEERKSGRFVFHIRHSAEARARALAKRALAAGVKSFAILGPKDNYGASVGQAFADEVKRAGGTIATTVSYPPGTKSFVTIVDQLAGPSWDALFVPDEARQLALIAPSLSARKMIPKPFGTKRATGGRPIWLLSTAEDLTGALVADAGRHTEGALLAPGFYPDIDDATVRPFVDRFIAAFGRAPGVVEAYAYDAAQLAAAASGNGRNALATALANASSQGLTGEIRFDANHRRADPGVLYEVVEDSGQIAIHVYKKP